jgi:predicted NUDIX family phosphoesterase
MTDTPEQVLVLPTARLRPHLGAGMIRGRGAEAILEMVAAEPAFIDRPLAERSEEWRQIIPYVVIRHGGNIFVLERTAKQTEARLHHKLSIGIGGHVNPRHDLMAGLQKELDEEVRVGGEYTLTFAGMLNDESTEVGRVHLGAVFLLDAATPDVEVLERDKMHGGWMDRASLARVRERLETWSQIVYDDLLA